MTVLLAKLTARTVVSINTRANMQPSCSKLPEKVHMVDYAGPDWNKHNIRITVIVACYNASRFVDAAISSALAQTVDDIEVIVVDDGSTDDSVERVRRIAQQDTRVRLLHTAENGGPAAARNVGLAAASGEWIAVLDSDDLMHPERFERLLAMADRDAADIVADDCLIFDDDGASPPSTALGARRAPFWVDATEYVRANCLYGRSTALGYLKPLIRHDLIRRGSVRYDPRLRIAEDYDFVLRLLAGGARLRVRPELTYFYRKHGASISHRLSIDKLRPMLLADDAFRSDFNPRDRMLTRALDERRRSILRAIEFDRLVSAIRQRRWQGALGVAMRWPSTVAMLRMALAARVSRLIPRPRRAASDAPSVCVISRQRVVGSTNGSSAYLLSLCRSLRAAGFAINLVAPSPAVFGRWPFLRLTPEMGLFGEIHVRRGWRVGPVIVALDPRIAMLAVATVADRLLGRLGIGSGRNVRPAPYAVAVPWTTPDFLFVARHVPRAADIVIVDYAFLTEAIPYALRPESPSVVIMHDMFSSRPAQFARLEADDSVELLNEAEEIALLAKADAVIAIQADEGRFVSRHLPGKRVIVAPMATTADADPQPGIDGTVLFVGSNTAPNVLGLRWFLDQVWPEVRRAVPGVRLAVAGTVAGQFGPEVGRDVDLLGLVADLAPLYRNAAVVISPLLVGSGLKIKLVEALGHGKATVVTDATIQGVEALVRDCVCLANDPDTFAAKVVALLRDPGRRLELGQAALAVVNQHFSAQACHAEFQAFAVSSVRSPQRGRCAIASTSEVQAALSPTSASS